MCGLIGYIGDEPAAKILSEALLRLEYRGYDSAGVAIINDGNIFLAKDTGNVAHVLQECNVEKLKGNLGIGHTRWATHGGVTKENAHPHCDDKMQIAVVHNGSIENYVELRKRLSRKHEFISETDTEVIPLLIRDYIDSGLAFELAVFATAKELKGSYSILAVSTLDPDKIIAVRNESPLVVGLGEKSNYVGSDVLSFLPYTKNVVFLSDKEAAVITKDKVCFYNENHEELSKKVTQIQWDWKTGTKGNYDHHMLKEIEEQPQAIRQAIIQDDKQINRMAIEILRSRQIVFVGCGTSRNAALIGRYVFSKIGHVFSDVILGSEFGYFVDSVDKGTLVIAVSQSGETADVLSGLQKAKAKGATVFSLVNMMGSSLSRLSDKTLYLNAGPEIGVAATKSFVAQLSLLYLLAFAMNGEIENGQKMLRAVSNLIETDLSYHSSVIPDIVNKIKSKNDVYFLAKGINFAMAGEGALKLKEISYIHAEGLSAGELKHGSLALIEEGTPLVVICPTDYTHTDILSNIMEAKARGGYIIGISDSPDPSFDDYIPISKVDEVLYPMITVVPLQQLAYYCAVARGLDPDKPRNLAKSVTVK
jgi:glucosamine--fructose-6-phosphate aminotransferase (isomerizing)